MEIYPQITICVYIWHIFKNNYLYLNYMKKRSTKELIRKIIESISKSPKSITQVTEETGLDRSTVSDYLIILKDSGLVIEEKEGTKKNFLIIPHYRLDTYFGLPITDDTFKLISSLYHKIRSVWKTKTSRQLYKMDMQKIVYEITKKCDLSIPVGWYIYGGIEVFPYDPLTSYENFNFLTEKQEKYAEEITTEYAQNKFAYQSKKLQYEKAGKQIYLIKEEILSILYYNNFGDNPKRLLEKVVNKVKEIKENLDFTNDRLNKFLLNYIELLEDIIALSSENKISEYNIEQRETFESVWKLIALFNFKNDLEKYYSVEMLDAHFKLDIEQQFEIVKENCSNLRLVIETRRYDDEKLYQSINNAIKKLKKKKGNKSVNQDEVLDLLGLN